MYTVDVTVVMTTFMHVSHGWMLQFSFVYQKKIILYIILLLEVYSLRISLTYIYVQCAQLYICIGTYVMLWLWLFCFLHCWPVVVPEKWIQCCSVRHSDSTASTSTQLHIHRVGGHADWGWTSGQWYNEATEVNRRYEGSDGWGLLCSGQLLLCIRMFNLYVYVYTYVYMIIDIKTLNPTIYIFM